MQRTAQHFELGYPHFCDRINYRWPTNEIAQTQDLANRLTEIAPFLIDKTKTYLTQFGVFTQMPQYPRAEIGTDAIALHFGDDARYLIVDTKKRAGVFLGEHNLFSWKANAAAFNIGSDVLEYIVPTIVAPRILGSGDKFTLQYPIPSGQNKIDPKLLTTELLSRLYGIVNMPTDARIENGAKTQRITSSGGEIRIENGFCTGVDFKDYQLAPASWVIAKIMTFYGK